MRRKIERWMWLTVRESSRQAVHQGDKLVLTPPGTVKSQPITVLIQTPEQVRGWNDDSIPLLAMLHDQGPRYYRECYIQERVIRWAHTDGTMTFAKIYVEANGSRWAVLRDLDNQYVATDLWEATTNQNFEQVFIGKQHTFPTRDAAIAAAILL